ncbi:2609_t:CDS:2 [Funneliformis geosporum]|uniref:2609_t:CDS:1 n=1 Tax=Funneliformis geosporum TaxID=1117311 RepID=A0A9W4SIE5_9GLOM|nr:2609_t:CDS:2 [Funneliformis geosporum]
MYLLPPSPINSVSSTQSSPNISDCEGFPHPMYTKSQVKVLLDMFPPQTTAEKYVKENSFQSNDHIKRPPNCFMIFRKMSHDKKNKTPALKHYNEREFSSIIGEIWKELSPEELQIYRNLSKEIVDLHHVMFPDYKYKPKRDKAAWKQYVPTNDENPSKKSKDKRKPKPKHATRQEKQQEPLNNINYPITPEPELLTISQNEIDFNFLSTPTSIPSISPIALTPITPIDQIDQLDLFYLYKADPYVSLSMDKQNKQKTRVIKNAGSEATWNEKLTFDVLEGRNELFLEVFDEDVVNDELIGETTIPLFQVFQQGYTEQWVNITRPSGKPSGEIHLYMNFKKQGPTSGPPGHTPYPVPGGSGYFSPPNSGSSASSNTPPAGKQPYHGYAGNQAQPQGFGNLGPEGGALPSGYGSGTPPPVTLPHSAGPPAYPTAGGGFPDPSSYGGQAQSYYQQPSYGAHPSDSKNISPGPKEHKSGGDKDWMTTAGIAAASAVGAGALGYLGGKLHSDHKHEETGNKDKHKNDEKDEKKYKDKDKHKKDEKKDKHKDEKHDKHKDEKKDKHKDEKKEKKKDKKDH